MRGNSGRDGIGDSGGRDHLFLTNYAESELKFRAVDLNNNGKADTLLIYLGKGTKNTVTIYNMYDDTKRKGPLRPGVGWIEDIRVKQGGGGGCVIDCILK